jgi:cytochrome d ubiquinol oxidase subunit II
VFVRRRHSGLAFAATALGAVATVATLFTSLYPRVIVSSPNFQNSLTVSSAASSHYALKTITIIALVLTPIVLLYQAWTYHVFRARLGGETVAAPGEVAAPSDAAPRPGGTPAA